MIAKEIKDFLDDDYDDNLSLDLGDKPPTTQQDTTTATAMFDENGYTLPFTAFEEEQEGVATALIHQVARRDTALARDIAYFGQVDMAYILQSYNMTAEDLAVRLKDERFSSMVEKFALDIGNDNEGLMKFRAKSYLETVGLSRLQRVIANPNTKDENVIKAITLMSQLGGAMPKAGEVGGGGGNIVFNFGSNNPIMPKQVTIDHE